MKKKIVVLLIFPLIVSCLVAILSTGISAENKTVNREKLNDIKNLLVMSGSSELGKQMMWQMINSFKGIMPNVPDNFWREFMNEADMDELMDKLVPIYDKYLSHDDIKELVKFYESSAGKRYVKALPQISKESMTIGQEWGEEIGKKVLKKLKEKGYK